MSKPNDPFKSVPKELWPVQAELWSKEFIPAQMEALSHINNLAEQNVFDNQTVLNHRQLVNWIGGKAFSSFEFSSSKFWSENDMKNQNVEWNLALWQFVHIFPIGFMIANHSLRNEPYRSWNPASESLKSFSKRGVYISNSNRAICGGMIGLGLFHNLFITKDTDPAIYKAVLDAFSPYSNLDNPISSSMRRAIRASLFTNPYPIPYFWEKAIAYLFERSPEDYESFKNHLKFGAAVNPDDVAASLQKTMNMVTSSHMASAKSSEADKPAPEDMVEALIDPNAIQPVENVEPEVARTEKPKEEQNSQNEHQRLFARFIEQIKIQYENHKSPLNQKGAMFHKVGGYWFSVHPVVINIAIKIINEEDGTSITIDEIMHILNALGFSEAKGAFMQNGELKSNVNLLNWPNDVVELVLGEKMNAKDNKGLSLV